MSDYWLWLSAGSMVATGFAHSYFGERRLVAPILAYREGVITRPLAQQVVRLAWHFTTVLMLLAAAVVAWPGTPRPLVLVTGAVWLAVGLIDALATRLQHIGWPLITVAGLAAIAGSLF